jgi:putative holliday junction resolvase
MITENHKDFIEKVKAINPKYKLMGLDVGQKKIGVAFVSADSLVVTPFKTLLRKNAAFDMQMLKSVAKDYGVHGIVIGLPLELTGNEGVAAKKMRHFCEKLGEALNLPMTMEDERFTTSIANDMLIETGMNRKTRSRIDDQVSAQVILESFMGHIS